MRADASNLTPSLLHAVGDFHLWDKWVDASSSNVEFALKFRVPTLVGKAATLSSSTRAGLVNMRSIVVGGSVVVATTC